MSVVAGTIVKALIDLTTFCIVGSLSVENQPVAFIKLNGISSTYTSHLELFEFRKPDEKLHGRVSLLEEHMT